MTYQPVPKFAIGPIYRALGGECGDHRTGKQKVRCFLHDDSRPSATLDFANNRFVCYVCDFGGDGLDLIMEAENVGFQDSVRRAESITGGAGPQVQQQRQDDTPGLFGKPRARRH